MTGGQRFSGQTIRRYDEHAEHSRRALFAKDREITKLGARARKAESTLEYIGWVMRDEGQRDPVWVLERIMEALFSHGYWERCEEHLAPQPCAACLEDSR